jgi:response regulator RpfG family c-di-GMP phosphodiesterase
MAEEEIRVLYIDDVPHNLTAFKANFRKIYKVLTAESAKEALEIIKKHNHKDSKENIQIIISDQRMPEQTGVDFFESLLNTYPEPIRMLLTGYTDINAVIDAINRGQVYRYITKPWSEHDLKINIDKAFEVYTLRETNKKLTNDLARVNRQLEFMLRQKLLS